MASVPPAYFDALYDQDSDPWKFETSAYETGKYQATLKALPKKRYGAALEVGCSIGILTAAVAERCDSLLAIDVAEAALAQARVRNAGSPHVRFERAAFPLNMPTHIPESFDLILLSEVLYYLDEATLLEAARTTLSLAATGATLALVHWLGPTPDYPLTGDEAANKFIDALGVDACKISAERRPDYRIDLLQC